MAFEHARYAEALDYARRASRLAPQSSRYLVVLGDAYFKLLRYDDAQATYQKAHALAPKDDAIKSRLDALSNDDDFQDACCLPVDTYEVTPEMQRMTQPKQQGG